jgi:hypothetical protein
VSICQNELKEDGYTRATAMATKMLYSNKEVGEAQERIERILQDNRSYSRGLEQRSKGEKIGV